MIRGIIHILFLISPQKHMLCYILEASWQITYVFYGEIRQQQYFFLLKKSALSGAMWKQQGTMFLLWSPARALYIVPLKSFTFL